MRTLDNAYALIIGVDYKQEMEQVQHDAIAINNILSDKSLCGYKEENIILLLDKDATMQNIMDALDKLIEITNEDSSILFFYSGHGGLYNGISFLCPYDKSPDIYISGSELREKLNAIKSKRMVILFDCCHSAGFFKGEGKEVTRTVSESTPHHEENMSHIEGLAQEIDDDQGIVIVTSCQESELSWTTTGNYSVFTACLLEVLQGQHKMYFADEFIRMTETVNYLWKHVPEMSASQAGGAQQNPYINLQMNKDFVLSYIPEKLRDHIVTNTFGPAKIAKAPTVSKSEPEEDESWQRDEGNNLILFIHGFSGESVNTFGIIPKLLQSDSKMDGWAMRPLGYSHYVKPELGKDIWAAIDDVDKIANYLKTSICYKFKKYDRIAIIAHSLGGLVAQKAILELSDEERKRISHLVMFGTPSNGISEEMLSKQWNSKYKEMSSEGPFITSLRHQWSETFKNGIPFKLKVAAATEDQYVTVESCHGPFAKEYCEFVDNDHLKMVKPQDENDDAFNLIKDTLTNSTFYNQYTNSEEINITLGKYDAVVKELLPKVADLDLNGLRQLIFSLEGLDRKDEAVKILNEHPLAKENTDLMGILGGRYKRAYLNSYSKKDGDAAFNYYSKALELAIKAEDYSQIYYHAINLAFLSIVMENNEGQMMKYAKQALDATENCRNNLWKYATVAEANMYIGDMDKAVEFYTKAAQMADIRQKISMHTNAYAGYVALMQSDNEDDFIKFLKASFLS